MRRACFGGFGALSGAEGFDVCPEVVEGCADLLFAGSEMLV